MSKQRSKFTLGPKPATAAPPFPKKRLAPAKRDVPKQQKRTTAVLNVPADEAEREDDPAEDSFTVKLPRAQLQLEYDAILQERELLLNQLAGLLEGLMVSAPADS
jgi:hypothetical protein